MTYVIYFIGIYAALALGYWLGKGDGEIPIMEDRDECYRLASIRAEYIDELGNKLNHSFSTYTEELPDGTIRQNIIRNN